MNSEMEFFVDEWFFQTETNGDGGGEEEAEMNGDAEDADEPVDEDAAFERRKRLKMAKTSEDENDENNENNEETAAGK